MLPAGAFALLIRVIVNNPKLKFLFKLHLFKFQGSGFFWSPLARSLNNFYPFENWFSRFCESV